MTRLPDVRHIDGAVLLGASSLQRDDTFTAVSPATGEPIGPTFSQATPDDVDQACALASAASHSFAEMAPSARADFLDAIGDAIAAIGEPLIQTAVLETALPRMRIEGERARTINQLRLFADVLRRGEWIDATIDLALPERTPSARPDLRRLNVAVGPVAVFGASNFPLAFSVAGGDTASALAAGCPVVVKGHPAHPGTGEHVGRAIRRAAIDCGIHPGVFSLLPGTRHEIGGALVADARIKAVGFTGSRAGGRALVAIAAQREEPIPVYAEMSSVNPVILLPAALRARGHDIAKAFAASMTMGAGQFCTNPGLIIAIDGPELDGFVDVARDAVADSLAAPMLSGSIHAAYERGVEALEDHPAISTIARGRMTGSGVAGCAALFVTNAASFMSDPALAFEVFGASSLIVRCSHVDEMARLLEALEGQLTVTFHMDGSDEPLAAMLLPIAARKAGRILANGWPTGVEVCDAMVHGGPFPATSNPLTTSVGTLAINRFLRPVCYQDLPDHLLPVALRRSNRWGLPRRINGVITLP